MLGAVGNVAGDYTSPSQVAADGSDRSTGSSRQRTVVQGGLGQAEVGYLQGDRPQMKGRTGMRKIVSHL